MYGEKLISVEAPPSEDGTTSKIEYRVWNPFRSKLAAAILGGVDGIHIVPGAKVRKGARTHGMAFDIATYLVVFGNTPSIWDYRQYLGTPPKGT